MSSSVQNHSPMQWLLAQVPVPNNFGPAGNKHQEEEYYYPQDFIENYSEQLLNFEAPIIQGLKSVTSSAKTLQNILNTNIFKKPFVIWNTNSEGDYILHKSNCIDISENKRNIFYNHNLQIKKIIVNNQIKDKLDSITTNCNSSIDLTQKLGSPSKFLEVKNRMVTSSSSNDSLLCNVHPQIAKKKLKNCSKQVPFGEQSGLDIYQTGNIKKEPQIITNTESSEVHQESFSVLTPKSACEVKNNVLIEEKASFKSNETLKLLDTRENYISLKDDRIFKDLQCAKDPELKEVGKILENVLWNKPAYPNYKIDRPNEKQSCEGGTDTGYSSRCSTPPSPANSSEPIVEKEIVENRLQGSNIPFPNQNNKEHRSKSPSDCSESSQGSYQPKPKRKNTNYQHNGFHNQFESYSAGNRDDTFIAQKQNWQNNRPGYTVNNHYRNTPVQNGYQKIQHSPSNYSYNNNIPQNSSHNNEFTNGSKYCYSNNSSRHCNLNRGNKIAYGFNQRPHVGRGRPFANSVCNHPQQNQQLLSHPNSFQNNNSNNNSHIYYQINPQFDIRGNVLGFQRKLTDAAGTFTVNRSNARWGIDYRAEATVIPPDLLTESKWDALSLQVWETFSQHQQLEATFRAKLELKDRISRVIWNILPMCRLFVVGSSLSGFGANSSDVDMCLMVTPKDLDQRNDAQAVLRLLQRELNNCGFAEKMELITAKVPILKFRDSKTGIDVDLNCNNSVGIRNTHLLNAYSQLDWRVRPLVLVVKLWAQHHQINNAKDMTISSYSLVLMVIHYLQNGTPTPLLPCLHRSYPDKFNSVNHVFKIPVTERIPLFVSNNEQTLGELFLGFLEYYAEKFKFIKDTISVRVGSILPTEECRFYRTKKNDSRMWKYLCIEEPFDMTNTARSVYDEVVFEKVKSVFKHSLSKLKETRDLNSIFSQPSVPNN